MCSNKPVGVSSRGDWYYQDLCQGNCSALRQRQHRVGASCWNGIRIIMWTYTNDDLFYVRAGSIVLDKMQPELLHEYVRISLMASMAWFFGTDVDSHGSMEKRAGRIEYTRQNSWKHAAEETTVDDRWRLLQLRKSCSTCRKIWNECWNIVEPKKL